MTDDCWLLAVGNATQALTSLKQRRLATATNSPTFTADQGYTFDGSTNYIDTGFIASTHATIAGQQSAHICAYSRTNLSSGFDAGASSSGSRNWTIRVRTGANATASFNSVTTATIASPSALGLHCATRTGDTFEMYRNGASLGTYVPSSFITATLVASSLWIGALNSSGTFSTGSARQTAFVGVGASLTAAQNLALYNAVQSYMTAIGANV